MKEYVINGHTFTRETLVEAMTDMDYHFSIKEVKESMQKHPTLKDVADNDLNRCIVLMAVAKAMTQFDCLMDEKEIKDLQKLTDEMVIEHYSR